MLTPTFSSIFYGNFYLFPLNALRLWSMGTGCLDKNGYLKLYCTAWLLFLFLVLHSNRLSRLLFPSGRMTLAVYIIERLTAL